MGGSAGWGGRAGAWITTKSGMGDGGSRVGAWLTTESGALGLQWIWQSAPGCQMRANTIDQYCQFFLYIHTFGFSDGQVTLLQSQTSALTVN